MNEERRQILDMLTAGKITAEEAERLLDKLGADTGGPEPHNQPRETERPGKVKYLRVLVDSTDGDKVNVRVPVALIRTGIKLSAILPNEASEKMEESGLDFSKLSDLDDEELYEALRELQVDVDSSDGDTVRVFCE
jgi:hypothetical protein